MNIKAILFDMDGVLMDSEYYYMNGTLSWMKEHGYQKEDSLVYKLIGTTMAQTYDLLYDLMDGRYTKEVLEDLNETYFKEHPLNVKEIMFDGVEDVLIELHKMGIKCALCSSSSLNAIHAHLSTMGIDKYFDVISSSESFSRAKPYPDIYLAAMEKLQVSANECIVYEDSRIGISAGVSSGAYCIAREDNRFGQDQSQAALIVKDIKELLEFVRVNNGRDI